MAKQTMTRTEATKLVVGLILDAGITVLRAGDRQVADLGALIEASLAGVSVEEARS